MDNLQELTAMAVILGGESFATNDPDGESLSEMADELEAIDTGSDKVPFVAINPESVEMSENVDMLEENEGNDRERCSPLSGDQLQQALLSNNNDKKSKADPSKLVCAIAQVQPGLVVAVSKRYRANCPWFLGIPDCLSLGSDRRLHMGDEVEIPNFAWKNGYEVLRHLDQSGTSPVWLNVGNINIQATATKVNVTQTSSVVPKMGIVLNVKRRAARDSNCIQCLSVITHGMTTAQQLPGWSLGTKDWFRAGQAVLVETVQLTRPNLWKVNPTYALPIPCPFGQPGDRKAYQPVVAIGVNQSPIVHKFPFRRGDSDASVVQGEHTIAAAISACLNKLEDDIQRFTVVADPQIEFGAKRDTAIISIRHMVEKKQDLVEFSRMWAEDQPIHARLAARGSKPCATGFIISADRQEVTEGFTLIATVFLAFQEAKDYDSWAAWERVTDGETIEIEPLHSRKILMQRAEKFALNFFTSMAKGSDGLSKIMAILMARQGERVPPQLTWHELFVANQPALDDLIGGQREAARLMLDAVPRVVFMQAPPGTGKTKVSADIIAAHLRAHPSGHVLFVAPLNVAVVKAVEEMAKTMERMDWKEDMLALFSGSGKKKYMQELKKIGSHLLATALRAPNLFEELEDKEKRLVKRYIEACESSPRTADEGKAARILLSKEKRRLVFCTLSMAEQIGGIFDETDLVVVDESGQAPFAQLLSMLVNFPKLNKLLVTGDRWQLSVNLMDVPEAVHNSYGLDTTILNLDSASGVDRTTLTVNFRSHPFLTECVEAGVYAAHGEMLTPGRNAAQMDQFTVKTPIALPVPECPLILIHQSDQMQEDTTSFSATNPAQTRTVIECITALRPSFQGVIRIVCFYAGQAKDIGLALSALDMQEVLVSTVDGCQGHEAEFTFVVTTKTGASSTASGAFWNDERRVNVALSRSKYGMMVIGDLKLLWAAGGIWRRFLRKALLKAVAVTPEYAHVMMNPNPQFRDGVIMGSYGPVIATDFYDDWSGSGYPAPRPPTTHQPVAPIVRQPTSTANRHVPAGLCHYCLRPGHFIRECPERPGFSRGVNTPRRAGYRPRGWTDSNRRPNGRGRRND